MTVGPRLGRVNRFALATDKHVCDYVTTLRARALGLPTWASAQIDIPISFCVGSSVFYNVSHHFGLSRSIWNGCDALYFNVFKLLKSFCFDSGSITLHCSMQRQRACNKKPYSTTPRILS